MTASEQIQAAFIAFYGRPADPAGLDYWAGQLQNAGGLGAIINAFGNSAESQALYDGETNAQRVTKVYQQILGREPDAAGLDYYVNELDSGRITLASFALDVYNGARGDDQTLVDKKFEAAQQFTQTLEAESAGRHYVGIEDAQRARELLESVTLSSSDSAFQQDLNTFVDNIYDSYYYSISGNIGTYGPEIEGENGDFAFAYSTNTRNGPGEGYSGEIFISKIDDSLSVTNEVLIGDRFDQSFRDYTTTADGGVAVIGTEGRNTGFVTKVDDQLDMVGSVRIGNGDGRVLLNDVASTDDGGVVAVGVQNAVADANDAYIAVFNPDMSLKAERRLDLPTETSSDETFTQVEALSGGGILAWNNNQMVLFDSELRVEQQKVFDNSLLPRQITELDNGQLLISSANRYGNDSKMVLLNSDLSIDSAWRVDGNNGFAINQNGDIGIAFDVMFDLPADASRPVAFFDVEDFLSSKNSITSFDMKYVSTRGGGWGTEFEEISANGEEFVLQNDDTLFTVKPGRESTPNLSADYRLNDFDGSITLDSIDTTSSRYPSFFDGQWESGDIGLVGVAEYGSVGLDGGIIVTQQSAI